MNDLGAGDAPEVVVSRPARGGLARLIERQVDASPDAEALCFDGAGITYRELDRHANRLAHRLRASGVGPDTPVSICAERSLELVVGLLAILKAGGAYVPIDPGYPAGRIEFMLQDAAAPVLMTQSHLAARLPRTPADVVELDGLLDDESPSPRPDPEVDPHHLAYIIYTSGSTGRPKGAMNTHAGICNRLLWMQAQFGLEAGEAVLQKTPFSFDVSVWEFFWPLMTGARLVIARPGGHQDPSYIADLIDAEDIGVIHFVPSMLQLFLEQQSLVERCRSLRLVVCSGEALSPELNRRFFARLGETGAALYNLYGPTEAAVDVTCWRCEEEPGSGPVPIGRPVDNTRIHLVDESMAPVADGDVGELCIGGVQVARGYLNRPDLTAERFVPDPFVDAPGARLYKTGDLARARPDGNFEFLGRIDHQVKVRGFRIELGEVESTLESHDDVLQAVVVAHGDEPADKRLVAYVVTRDAGAASMAALRRHLESRLPEYMIPAIFVAIDRVPLTPNGKVDRSALPPPTRRRPDLEQPYVAPRDAIEQFVAAAWGDVIGVDRVGVYDRFFELGGDSLQAARFIDTMRRELDEFVYVTTIFEAPSAAEYASFLRRDYAAAVCRRFGVEARDGEPAERRGSEQEPRQLDARDVELLQAAVPTVAPHPTGNHREASNPAMVFVLAPPRSGTTLLRVMLAGHPSLFAAAELQLLGFDTLEQRRAAFTGKYSVWLEGTVRALMELHGCDAERAHAIMATFEAEGSSTKRFYRYLQAELGDRMLVDKSPQYALDPGALERAERDFDGPLYVHLVRHPLAVVSSFERYHMDQVLFLDDHPFDARQLGELVWLLSHRNIQTRLAAVPRHRQYRIGFEELVTRPREVMGGLCDHFGWKFDEALVEPYRNVDKKMTDGIYASSTPMGDTKFLERSVIDPGAAEQWKHDVDGDFLSPMTWQLAAEFGYQRPTEAAGERQSSGRGGRVAVGRASLQRRRRLRSDAGQARR